MAKPKKSKLSCAGCRNDFYNYSDPMGLSGGKPQCWSFDSMTIVKKKMVPLDQRPPWNQRPQWVPSCYRRKGYVAVDPDKTC